MFQFPAFASFTLFYSGEDTCQQPVTSNRQPEHEHALNERSALWSPVTGHWSLKVGFPIRKSSDQRVFAPPRRLSQRITSFIACACQGIHQLPLRHLIVLIANAHLRDPLAGSSLEPTTSKEIGVPARSEGSSRLSHRHKKTSFSRPVRGRG